MLLPLHGSRVIRLVRMSVISLYNVLLAALVQLFVCLFGQTIS
jgi:hypothetical protein